MRKILWLDLETTGLDPDTDQILEVSVVITDNQIDELGEFSAVVGHSPTVLEGMNEWCKEQHFRSGLTKEVLQSDITLTQAEDAIIRLIKACSTEDRIILAGSSVHFDKGFLKKHMPRLHRLLNYRIIDVSTFKETLAIVFNYYLQTSPDAKHRAREDIRGSIQEFRQYLKLFQVRAV